MNKTGAKRNGDYRVTQLILNVKVIGLLSLQKMKILLFCFTFFVVSFSLKKINDCC